MSATRRGRDSRREHHLSTSTTRALVLIALLRTHPTIHNGLIAGALQSGQGLVQVREQEMAEFEVKYAKKVDAGAQILALSRSCPKRCGLNADALSLCS